MQEKALPYLFVSLMLFSSFGGHILQNSVKHFIDVCTRTKTRLKKSIVQPMNTGNLCNYELMSRNINMFSSFNARATQWYAMTV